MSSFVVFYFSVKTFLPPNQHGTEISMEPTVRATEESPRCEFEFMSVQRTSKVGMQLCHQPGGPGWEKRDIRKELECFQNLCVFACGGAGPVEQLREAAQEREMS